MRVKTLLPLLQIHKVPFKGIKKMILSISVAKNENTVRIYSCCVVSNLFDLLCVVERKRIDLTELYLQYNERGLKLSSLKKTQKYHKSIIKIVRYVF